MNANDVIESYVTDVAVQLPRKQRNDVAFELRALINEELQDRGEAAGRGVDAAMATEFLQGFGHPDDVAARYRPALTIIDPADGHSFLRVTVIGLAIIWCLGLLQRLGQPIGSAGDVLNLLGQWWTGTAIPSLWWPGVLVVWFGLFNSDNGGGAWFWKNIVARALTSAWPGSHLLGYVDTPYLQRLDDSPDAMYGIDGVIGGLHLFTTPQLWIGVLALIYGVLQIIAAFRLRSLGKTIGAM